MKKAHAAIVCLLLGTTMLGGLSANAAEDKTATGKVTFTRGGDEGNNGLYIESVSDLDFGSQVISIQEQNYMTTGNKFEVVDISGLYSGWNLQVKQGAQFAANGSELNGAELTLTNIASDGTGVGTAPATVASSVKFDSMNQNFPIVSAEANQGKGKWGFDHGSNLEVPASALPNAAEYTTTLTWSLVSGPA
ncbi:WxL domain-containing protein [Enterococcus sp. 669A]|uniref:WxL domain-containing protein n=1 Tax=Candidatus Enterococcus moelleringii TaxID=2815325 RepID=A0ABS3LAT2_9ENTE|nr:WxL domain-containing protein [Enterococcus sp. 669A]MBO1306726.1 WxL domain-containing protein [Enterococcus sp. 669A]